MRNEQTKTLHQILGIELGRPEPADTDLVIRCKDLVHKPLKALTVADLATLVEQRIALDLILPMALDQLQVAPLVEGNYYPGDLLRSVIEGPPLSFWHENPDSLQILVSILDRAQSLSELMKAEDSEFIRAIVTGSTGSEIRCIFERGSCKS